MSDFNALRDEIARLMRTEGGGWTRNRLYAELERRAGGTPPFSRATFFRWFGHPPADATAILLESVPTLADILNSEPHMLYRTARVLPDDLEVALTVESAARSFRSASRTVSRALAGSGLSTTAEAVVLDRIMRRGLDYRITVFPVVRGRSQRFHLRTWLVLQPIADPTVEYRPRMVGLDTRTVTEKQDYLRYDVVTDGLWRSLGLRWRSPPPIEWPYPNDIPELFLEVPVEERDRSHPPTMSPAPGPRRIMVLSAIWGHVEPLIAMLADALQWGSCDLRNQGFSFLDESDAKVDFCRELLADDTPGLVWAIAEQSSVFRDLAPDVAAAAGHHMIVWVDYGTRFAQAAAEAFRLTLPKVELSRRAAQSTVARVNEHHRVLYVKIADDDVVHAHSNAPSRVDRDLVVEHVRFTAAEIMNELVSLGGPPIAEWGPRFTDLQRGAGPRAHVPHRRTTVRWREPGTVSQPTNAV